MLPAAPTGLVATGSEAAVSSTGALLNAATRDTYRRSLTSGSGYTMPAGGTTAATSYTDSGLSNGTTYHYVVRAVTPGAASGNSNQASATPLTTLQAWRQANFETTENSGPAADSADPDGDGWRNAQEFASGTDPNNRASLLKISQMTPSGTDMVLSFSTIVGKIYRLEHSDTLQNGSWIITQDNIAGTGEHVQITDPDGAVQPLRFYRIVVDP